MPRTDRLRVRIVLALRLCRWYSELLLLEMTADDPRRSVPRGGAIFLAVAAAALSSANAKHIFVACAIPPGAVDGLFSVTA
jgi:hypothetical protein